MSNEHSCITHYFTIVHYLSKNIWYMGWYIFISDLAPNNYLIASVYMSCLQSLISNPFNSKLSPFIFQIKSFIYTLKQSNHHIQFLWIPSHVGIHGNETADGLAKAASNTILPPLAQLPWSDFSPLLSRHITSLLTIGIIC